MKRLTRIEHRLDRIESKLDITLERVTVLLDNMATDAISAEDVDQRQIDDLRLEMRASIQDMRSDLDWIGEG